MNKTVLLAVLCAGISIAHAGGPTKGTGGFNTSRLNGIDSELPAAIQEGPSNLRYSAIVLGQDRDALVSGGPRTGTGGLNSASLNGVSASSEEPVDSPAANHRYSAILLGHDNGAQLISGGPTKGSGGINGSRLTGRRNAP